MKIETQNYDKITVIELHGELIEEFVKKLQDTASSVMASGVSGIVLDMTNVSFIDSKGLEQLLWLGDYCDENKRQLKFTGFDESCSKILEITRLGPRFDTYAELTEAVKSFA
jgi:anti-anti-sigma factor